MNKLFKMLISGLGMIWGLGAAVPAIAQTAPSTTGTPLSFEQIKKRVETENPGARVTSIELDDDPWRQVYEVEIVDSGGAGWDLDFHAHTGELLKRERDN